ncbi:class I SAM-dependent methyltransferase [Amycolatopsis anabasis]|uniref:class I SAM-dependent methyltransferase n=1 Tax=Amycolatopsis anabasis TaxID=1840409 RepID=UPI00131C556A|nr:methyltransferase domain-containing protein [Amycolatopsis anabasis]
MTELAPRLSAAHRKALPLLASGVPEPSVVGYLDLLDPAPVPAPNRAQALWSRRWGAAFYANLQSMRRRLMDVNGSPRDRLRPAPGETVLDLGCGPGDITRQLADAVTSSGLVVGVDLSAEMLTRAVRDASAGNIAFFRGDATRLPFSDGMFDAVCCSAMFQLLPDPFAALDAMTRVLAPGGRVFILTTHRGRGLAERLSCALVGRLSGARMFAPSAIPDALAERGYRDIDQRFTGMLQTVVAVR